MSFLWGLMVGSMETLYLGLEAYYPRQGWGGLPYEKVRDAHGLT